MSYKAPSESEWSATTAKEAGALLRPLMAEVERLSGSPTSGTGGIYLTKAGVEVPYVMVVSDTDPGTTRTINGVVHEVWWVQTAPPDPMQSVPAQVTQSIEGRSYTVPSDPAATYTIDGVPTTAGTYPIGTTAAKTIAWAAVAKSGYGFKAGAVTSGSLSWDAKTYGSGDVLMSDSFNRADGPLVGSTSDSFDGGEPYVWQAHSGNPLIVSGVPAPDPSVQLSFPKYVWPVAQQSPDVHITAKYHAAGSSNARITVVDTANKSTHLNFGPTCTVYDETGSPGGVRVSLSGNSVGDVIEFSSTGLVWTIRNLTKSTQATGEAPRPASTNYVHFYWDMRTPDGGFRLDDIKVSVP